MHRLRDDLRAAGFMVWTDEGIEPGTPSWKAEIEKALRECDCQVIIFSPDANNSRWVHAEIDFAEALHKPMFPVLARGDETTAIPFGFSTYQWIDIRKASDYQSGFRLLTDALLNKLNRSQDGPPAQIRPVTAARGQRFVRPIGILVAIAAIILALLSLLAPALQPDSPSFTATPNGDVATSAAVLASPIPTSTSASTLQPASASGTPIDCALLSELPTYEQVDSPTLSLPEEWVQLSSDTVTLAVPAEYYRPSDAYLLDAFFSTLFEHTTPEFREFTCDWNLEIFFLQMSGLHGGGIASRPSGAPLSLQAQQHYYEEAFSETATVDSEIVSLPAGDMLRLNITLRLEGQDTKLIVYSISRGTTLYAIFNFAADGVDEHLDLIDEIAQTFRFVEE